MSLSILSQPSTLLQSANNDTVYSVSGSNALAPNVFDYQYMVDVLINGEVEATLPAFPDVNYNYGVFHLENTIANFVSYDFPFTDSTASIFQTASNSFCQAQLNFFEQYTLGTAFSQSATLATSSQFYYLNSSLTYVDQVTGNLNNYLVTNATSSTVDFLTTFSGSISTYNNLRNHLYFFSSASNDSYLFIQTYDSSNNALGSYYVFNIYSNYIGVQSVATGYPTLSQLISGSVSTNGHYGVNSGNQVMFNSSVTSYTVHLVNGSLQPLTKSRTFTIGDNTGRWQNYIMNVYFLNDRGGFEAYQMNRKNVSSIKKSTSSFKKQPGTLQSNGQFIFNTYDRQTTNFYTELENSIECYTDWLTNSQAAYLMRALFSSPVIYLEDLNGTIQAANVTDDNFKILNSTLQKGVQIKFNFKLSAQDFRQAQ